MGTFNWQDQDDDENWELTQTAAVEAADEQAGATFFGRNRLRQMIGAVLVGLLVIGGIAWWWVGSVEDDLSADVLQSWRIVVDSERAGDTELLTNQLSGSDERWIQTQNDLLVREDLTKRGELLGSLNHVPAEPAGLPDVVFSPDLLEATLTHKVRYEDRWGRELTLAQDEVFRLGSDRWLYSPPKNSFWGQEAAEGNTRYTQRFAYSAPTRDLELAEKIILWFENRLDAICLSEFSPACQSTQTPQFEIRFSPIVTEEMLEGMVYVDRFFSNTSDGVFEFPTPSLIGRPLAPEDERLLIEAYGELFFAPYLDIVVRNQIVVSGGCVPDIANFAAQQVGAAAPVAVEDYERLLAYLNQFESGNDTVSLNDAAQQEFSSLFIKMTIQYQLQEGDLTPKSLLDLNLPRDAGSYCSRLYFPDGDWDEFVQFVELRASISN